QPRLYRRLPLGIKRNYPDDSPDSRHFANPPSGNSCGTLPRMTRCWTDGANSARSALASVEDTVGLQTFDLRRGEAEVILEQLGVMLYECRRRLLELFGKGGKPQWESGHVELSYKLIFDLGNRTASAQVRMVDCFFHRQNRGVWHAMLFQKR